MIALRGIVRQNEEKKWRWTGIWTFGSLPVDEEVALKAKNPTVRPFSYTWEEPREASKVLIPTANLGSSFGDVSSSAEGMQVDKKDGPVSEVKTEESHPSKVEDTADKSTTSVYNKKPGEEAPAESVADDSVKAEAMKVEDEADAPTTNDNDAKHEEEAMRKDNNAKEDTREETTAKSEEDLTQKKQEKSAGAPKGNVALESAKDDNKPIDGEPKTPANDSETTPAGKAEENVVKKKEPVTFATIQPGDPPFTEAATVYPEKCPPDGAWKGYFETATNRKDKSTFQVPENFSLFFNATPPKDSRVLFLDDDETATDSAGQLPPGRVHVRGTGSNQYGTWELTGSWDISTGVLECQRMYVRTREATPMAKRGRKPKASRSGIRLSTDDDGSGSGRQTRKRQPSWRKRVSLHSDDDVVIGRKSSGSGKKRQRLSSIDKTTTPAGATAAAMFLPPPGLEHLSIQPPTLSGRRSPPAPSPHVPAKATVSVGRKRASQSTVSSPTSSTSMKLPSAGDPNEARWRAAHFLYYQRYDPSAEEAGVTGSAGGASSTASFVVYEGEMREGNCMRDGRGICLYNNGTLYEGEWKRNKEHGIGTLMSADRRLIIYKGEWERGRMHGRGTYYYHQENPFVARREHESGEQKGSFYEGDFKENARHGSGKYVLPDGSVYDGEWLNDQMNGRGTFTWVDGSVYVGFWKDGKRHGQGVLQASDGFTYDGQFVKNAMDGRGIASYPSGQRYEGLWSNGRREGRGTIHFVNGAVYEGRFRDDCIEGQGTMKMTKNAVIQRSHEDGDEGKGEELDDWMVPISFQSDIARIHEKAGFTVEGE